MSSEIIPNTIQKQYLRLGGYILLDTLGSRYDLRLIDAKANLLSSYTVQPGEDAILGLTGANYSYFTMSTQSLAAFDFTYDEIDYVAVTNYYGTNVTHKWVGAIGVNGSSLQGNQYQSNLYEENNTLDKNETSKAEIKEVLQQMLSEQKY